MELPPHLAAHILDDQSELILLVDAHGTIAWASGAVTPLLGYSRHEFVGRNGLDLFHPDDLELFAAALTVSMRNTGPYAEEQGRVRTADGSWAELRGLPVGKVDLDGRLHLVCRFRPVDFELQLSEAVRLIAADAPWRVAAVAVMAAGTTGRHSWNALWIPADGEGPQEWILPEDREHLRPALDELAASDTAPSERLWESDEPTPWLDADKLPPALRDFCAMADVPTFTAHPIRLGGEKVAVLVNWHDRTYGPLDQPVLSRHRALQISILTLAIEQERQLRRLRRAALTDPLTGLANRAGLWDGLSRIDRGMAAYLDLDGFKAINDTLGHHAGDEVLVEIAERLRVTCRHSEIAARVGGDEFVLVACDVTESEADLMARRILDALAEPIRLSGGEDCRVEASIGLSKIAGADDAEAAIVRADAAMLAAKSRAGRRREDTATRVG